MTKLINKQSTNSSATTANDRDTSFPFKILSLDYPAKPRWALDEKAAFLKGAGVKI